MYGKVSKKFGNLDQKRCEKKITRKITNFAKCECIKRERNIWDVCIDHFKKDLFVVVAIKVVKFEMGNIRI